MKRHLNTCSHPWTFVNFSKTIQKISKCTSAGSGFRIRRQFHKYKKNDTQRKLPKYKSKGLFKVNHPNNFLQMHFCRRLPLAYKADSQVLPQKLQILHPSHLLAPITWKWLFKACDQVMTNCNFLALQNLF